MITYSTITHKEMDIKPCIGVVYKDKDGDKDGDLMLWLGEELDKPWMVLHRKGHVFGTDRPTIAFADTDYPREPIEEFPYSELSKELY